MSIRTSTEQPDGRVVYSGANMAEFWTRDHGLVAEHNMPCPVCSMELAVLNVNSGVFQPCWDCMDGGWKTVRVKRGVSRWLLEAFGVIGKEFSNG